MRGARSVAATLALALLLARLPLAGAESTERKPGLVDLHVDLSYQHNYQGKPFAEGTGQYRERDLERAGVVGVVLPLYIPKRVSAQGPRAQDLESSYLAVFDKLGRSDGYALPGCTKQGDRVRTWLSFEGAAPLSGQLDAAVSWSARGVRVFGLVHSYDNALASSSGSASKASYGLSRAGRELAQRIASLSGVLDVSHASDRAADELIELGRRAGTPVIASHSNARALADHPRNLSDAQIRAIAATGGVVGVNFHGPFLVRGRPAKLSDVVAMVKYLVRVAGVEHVAIGSDYEGDVRPPPQLANVGQVQNLARTLRAAGLSREAVEKVFGLNALRVLCRQKA